MARQPQEKWVSSGWGAWTFAPQPPAPAPGPTEEAPAEAFLSPYRILDLCNERGAFGTKLLADMGADVIKVEPPGGDRQRRRGPFFGDQPHREKSLPFLYFNTSKRSITLNLEHKKGRDLFRELARRADAVVESSPPGHLKGLGLGYEELAQLNPRLVMASITPFGQTGSYRDYQATDLILMAMSGYMQVTGDPEGPPVRLGDEQSLYPPAMYSALGVVAALFFRDAVSGRGQYIDVSMQEALLTFYTENHPVVLWRRKGQNATRTGLLSRLAVPIGVYPCEDGWVGLGVVTPAEWLALSQWIAEATGNKDILEDKYKGGVQERRDYFEELNAYVTDFTARFSRQELFLEAQKRNVVAVPVNSVDDLLKDPHLAASGFWVELDHPVVGRLKYPRGPYLGGSIPVPRRAAPLLGEHSQEVYTSELGLTPQDLAVLIAEGVV